MAEFETEKLIEDSCKESSNKIQIIRCGAHTLQLAVNDVLEGYKSEFAKIAKLCVILRKPIFAQAWGTNNLNQPHLHNETRWTSSFNTIEYIYKNLDQIKILLSANLPGEFEELPELENLYNALGPVRLMTNSIQKETLTFGELYVELQKLYVELELINNPISEKLIEKISILSNFKLLIKLI